MTREGEKRDKKIVRGVIQLCVWQLFNLLQIKVFFILSTGSLDNQSCLQVDHVNRRQQVGFARSQNMTWWLKLEVCLKPKQ